MPLANISADTTYNAGGLPVKVKKIPFGTRWIKDCCGFRKGDLYKADRLMTGGTGKILGITIHNTDDSADAATYTLATFNQNMNTARVHFYVDDKEAWQNLEINEVGWHSGMGDLNKGNDSYIAIEIIMGAGYSEKDRRAESNGALLTAYLLRITGLSFDDIVTHKHWSGKNCPAFILPHWEDFMDLVKEKYAELEAADAEFSGGESSGSADDSALENTTDRAVPDNIPDEYAKAAVQKAQEREILKGGTDGDLMLHSPLTRQDLFVILERLGIL